MKEVFLISLTLIWIIFAVIQDIKKREIADWLNFSLLIFALGFRFFYSLFEADFNFLYQGLIGFGIFFVIGNMFYYMKIFAGGDAKLLISLGAILPLNYSFTQNIDGMLLFLFLFLIAGAIYGIFSSIYLAIKNSKAFKKEFKKQFKKHKNLAIATLFIAIFFVILGLNQIYLAYFAILIFILPYLYVFAKSVDEACMIKKISPKKLTPGDWLYKNVKVKNKTIKATWDGLTKDEIKLLQKQNKKVSIRQGIPFSPAFIISFIAWAYIVFIR